MNNLRQEMDEETSRSFSRMAYGHEMWIGDVVRKDGVITALGLYGHKLLPDKPMPTDYANVVLYDDNGRADTPERDIINKPRGWQFTFPDKGAEVYTLYIDSDSLWVVNDEGWHRGSKRDYDKITYSGSFNMIAKRIISKNRENPGSVMHAALEIMPDKASYKMGETAVFTILYEGKPLADHKVILFGAGWQDLHNDRTDADGKVSMKVDNPGSYVVIAKHNDPSKCKEDEYDETSFSSTLVVDAE